MVYSMTGFGRGQIQIDEWSLIMEIKTVNHRYFDFIMRGPEVFSPFQENIRRKISEKIHRGRIEVSLYYRKGESDVYEFIIHERLWDNIHRSLTKLAEKYNYEKPRLQDFFQFKEIYSLESKEINETKMKEAILKLTDQVMDQVLFMRRKEGNALEEDLRQNLQLMSISVTKLEEDAPIINREYEHRLRKKIEEMIQDQDYDEQRVLTEVAIFSEKSDIHEEITRLKSHIQYFKEILNEKKAKGRTLDFILQEMNREANTICSKSNHAGLTRDAVAIKSYIDQLKEQVQNIE
ncbi:MAG: YicC/YloC family endoribonuclease [Tissierellia bacterium]|nr:YicC/YloC family endoribonuclease [Tissierellia bacterium]